MVKFGSIWGGRLASFVFFLALGPVAARAQQGPPAAPGAEQSATQSATGKPEDASDSKANDELLAKAAKLYYSPRRRGWTVSTARFIPTGASFSPAQL